MNRLKLLAAAMLLAVPIISACGDAVDPPPPTGSIDGLVSIEGQGIDGVSVTLSNGGSAVTANGGMYRFDGVEAGAYTITISNYPDDASFDHTSAAATIATDGQTVTVNFPGTYIRTSSIMGTVTVDNEGLGGVTVTISGTGDSETLTDGNGQYAFTGLRAGNYTIEITGFDDEDVAFGSTSSAAEVGVGESKVVSFEGTYVRTSGIMGQVTADDQPQEDITVSLQGRGENRSMTTNSAGQFSFDELRRGDYAIGISGYDTDEMTFDETSQSVTVAYGETASVPFEGTLLRTAGISGTVTVEGVGPIANVTVTIQGEGQTRDDMTDHMGVYAFDGLPAGDYSVVISGFDDDQYGFPDGTSATVRVDLQETGTVPFDGIMLRTAAIEGTVTVGDDDAPLPGVMVTVSGGPRDEGHVRTTNDDGEYLVENLHAGTYSVTISGYDAREYGFDPTTESVTVGLRATGEVAFQGELLRTAGVSGRVSVNGMGIPGVTVTLTGEEDRDPINTDADGQYGFAGLAAGDYTLTISGWDEVEYHFEPTMEITLELDEVKSGVNFDGRALRTATVHGYVTVEGDALPGVSVTLIRVVTANSGEVLGMMPTGDNGGYSFGSLLAGAYQVRIAGYADEHDFAAGTTQTTTVMTDSTASVNFAATIIRTASVSGMVTVDDEAKAGVEVTLTGDHAPDDNTMTTGDDGMYSFGGLRKGNYTVTMTNPDAEAYNFPTVSLPVNLSVGQEQPGISFQGDLRRTAGVSGRVHVGGTGLPGVTVTLTGEESRDPIMTNADGQYGFAGLAAGDYTLTISGWDEVEYHFEPTTEVTLVLDEPMSGVNFDGTPLRTATVKGYVTVEEAPLRGVSVTLLKVVGTSGEIAGAMPTGDNGGYSFGPLLAGAYQVRIADNSDDADERDFGELGTTQTTMVMTDSTASVNFAATIIRTAGVSGMVTVDGEAEAGVEVTLTGDHAPADNTMTTGDDGMYSFGGLRKGDYTVSMTNPDAEAYSFPSTSQTLNLSVGQEQPGISFAGARLLQASISGQVHAEGDPVAGVMVTLSGDADAEDMTDANGEYNFPSLAGGDYMVTIAGWDDAAYEFASAESAVAGLGSDEFKIVDFEGTHTKTASISGMLFIDEGGQTALAHDAGEPVLDLDAVLPEDMPGLPITLLGPELTSPPTVGFASREGMYEFPGLRAGAYVINVNVETKIETDPMTNDSATVEEMLADLGYKYTGRSIVPVSVAAAEESTDNNLPFKITLQTINVGAVMGTAGLNGATETVVAGVRLTLYATTEAAEAGMNALGTGTTDSTGVATFHFPRAMDLGPGGTGNDNLVFAEVTSTGHADLVVSDNAHIEIEYAATDRVSHALTAARLLNQGVNFQWLIKSNADARDGTELLGGWKVVMGTDTIVTGADGKGSYSGTAVLGAEPAKYTVMADSTQADSLTMKERWTQSEAIVHTHNPLALPAMNTAKLNDLGAIYVTWTTQSLTLGVYREADDVEGFTDYRSALPGGDARPHSEVGAGMTVELMTRDSRDRLRLYDEWDDDCDDDGEKEMPTEPEDAKGDFASGMITFNCLPAGEEFTVRYNAGDDREQMDHDYDEIETFGDDLDFGVTVGAFGAMGGGQPEVRMCSASVSTPNTDATSDEWCATFAYQWETGEVYGTVGEERGHEVEVTPETTRHGEIGEEDETGTGGAYSIGDLQDGVYTAEATSGDAKFAILELLTPAEVEGIELYHNEACWAATNPKPATGDERPDSCAADEVDVGEDDDGETTYTYVNEHEEIWETGRLGLAIRGYVANDGQDGEDLDGLLRGDETMAGITMTLKKGAVTVDTKETTASGRYSFENLEAGTYTVSAGEASNAVAIHAIEEDDGDWDYVTSKTATAEDYTLTPVEAELAKPYWDRAMSAGGTMGNPKVTYEDPDDDTDPDEDTYYNFALVYTDGEVSGSVDNLSGDHGSIDIIISSPSPLEDDQKVETSNSGNFGLGGLLEAIGYTAVIEDAGFEAPCMNTDKEPDDDLEATDGTCETDGATSERFPDSLMADTDGENDHARMGTLVVYSTDASDDDALGAVTIKGGDGVETGADYDTATAWPTGWTRDDQTDPEVTTNDQSIGTTSFASRTVTVSFGILNASIPEDGSVKVQVNSKDCVGFTCLLPHNATDAGEDADAGEARVDTITVMATAENGYDDHVYSTLVTVAAPVGYALAADNIDATDSDGADLTVGGGTDGAVTVNNAFTLATAAGETKANVVFELTVLGDPDGTNAACAQSVSVKPLNGNALTAEDDDDDDVCLDTRYELTGTTGGQVYEIEVTSQDGKKITRYLTVTATPAQTN